MNIDVLLIVWVGAAVAMALAIGIVALFRPATAFRFFLRFRDRGNRGAVWYDRISSLPPYRWLLSGQSWRDVIGDGAEHPERFPRILAAYRILSAITVAMFVSVVCAFIVGVAVRG